MNDVMADPAQLLVGTTIFLALLAAWAWLSVAHGIDTSGERVAFRSLHQLRLAAAFTSAGLIAGVLAYWMSP